MPFKSQAQRRKFAELLVQGKITGDTYEEWNRETGGAKLPERVTRKSTKKREGTTARKRAKARTGAKARKATKKPKSAR